MSTKGNFFAVDWRCVREAGNHGNGPNTAVAYMALARFTGKNHTTTRASMTALHKYLGISRGRAANAIMDLEKAGLICAPMRGTTRRLVPWSEMQCKSRGISPRQRAVIDRVASGKNPIINSADEDYQVAYTLIFKGMLEKSPKDKAGSLFRLPEPDYVFLPNSIVDGYNKDEFPLARLVQLRDERAINVLLNVYRFSNLAEDGGLPTSYIRTDHDYLEAGMWGRYRICAFKEKVRNGAWEPLFSQFRPNEGEMDSGDDCHLQMWGTWDALLYAGLVEIVDYVFSDDRGGEALHPLALHSGTTEERGVAVAANTAARRLLTGPQIERVEKWAGGRKVLLCPVPAHITRANLIGVARPIHRANTSRTRAWAANFLHHCNEHRENFERLGISRLETAS